MDKISVVADYFNFIIPGIYDWFEDLHFEVGDLDPFQSSDQFFRFSAEHAAADHFDPAPSFTGQVGFNKHSIVFLKMCL